LVLDGLLARVARNEHADWLARLRRWDTEHGGCIAPCVPGAAAAFDADLGSPEVVRALKEQTGGAATLVADVGQHQMFVALHAGFDRPGSFFTSGGLGTMGYAVPAAL